MISYPEACRLLSLEKLRPAHEIIGVEAALGRVLAKDIRAPIDLPPFDTSSVDGFALNYQLTSSSLSFPIAASIRAMPQAPQILPPGQAVKIMTGAPLPRGADAVVMKEQADAALGQLSLTRPLSFLENVRLMGEDVTRGSLVARESSMISAPLLGLFLGLGLDRIEVKKRPRLKIIATGDELLPTGSPLRHGQVYYLVGPMLKAQGQQMGFSDIEVVMTGDGEAAIRSAIETGFDRDLILVSGGMSMGDHDLVRPALKGLGVEQIFFRGAWRPGKPLYFGKKGSTFVFGLPGNPVAAFICFHLFVRPFLCHDAAKPLEARLMTEQRKPGDLTLFLMAKVRDGRIFPLGGQGSHRLFTLSQANAICCFSGDRELIKEGERLPYYPI